MKKRFISTAIAFTMLISILAACGQADRPLTMAELLNLGERYLLEQSFDLALVQFLRVIEIEPMNPRGYLGAAEAYIGLGQPDRAMRILEQGLREIPDNLQIQSMLDELQASGQGSAVDSPSAQGRGNGADTQPNHNGVTQPGQDVVEQPDPSMLNGEYVWIASDFVVYRYYLIDSIPQPRGTSEEDSGLEVITETIMAHAIFRSSTDEPWSDWEVAPHYWAGLWCTDCGEMFSGPEMPEWFVYGFSHPWSGEFSSEIDFLEGRQLISYADYIVQR